MFRFRNLIGKSVNPVQKPNNDILPPAHFKASLTREIARAERTGKAFTMILIPINQCKNKIALCASIRDHLVSRIRVSDVIGWYDTDAIGLLLPETLHAGAQILSDEIDNLLEELHVVSSSRLIQYPSPDWPGTTVDFFTGDSHE